MHHIAIMKKEWNLLSKILEGKKTIESRWYKNKKAPYQKIKSGDILYFKDSGCPVSLKAKVTGVKNYEIYGNKQALEIMSKHAQEDLGTTHIPKEVLDYISDKKYAVFISFNNVKKVKPFDIDKRGYGMQSAWVTTDKIQKITRNPSSLI